MDGQRCLKNNIWHDWYRECHVRSRCWEIWGPCCGCQVLSSKEAPNGEEADKTTGGGLLGRVSKLTFHDFMTPHCWRCQIHPNSIFTTNFVYHLYNRQMDPGATEALKTRMGWALRQLRRGYTWIHKVAEPEKGRIYIDVFFLVPQIFKKANTHLTRNETSNCSIPLPKAHWRIRQ